MIYDFRLKLYPPWTLSLVSTCNQEILALWLNFTLVLSLDHKNKRDILIQSHILNKKVS